MSDLDNAIQSINTAAARTEGTTDFIDNLSTYDDNSSVTNPNNGVTVPSIAKQVKTRTGELFAGAESDINQSVADAAKSASDAEASALSLGYQGLWPDTGGSAYKGDTYQTQVGGIPTGLYFTALQDTIVDPVGDDVNWRVIVSSQNLGNLTSYQSDSVGDMITGKTWNKNEITLALGQHWSSGGTNWKLEDDSGTITLDNFRAFNAICVLDFKHLVVNNNWSPAFNAAFNHAVNVGGATQVFSDDSTPGASDGTNDTQKGARVYAPNNLYRCDDPLVIPISVGGRYSPIEFFGDGQMQTVLDFSNAPINTDSLTALGGFCSLHDFQVLRSRRDGIVVGDEGDAYASWNTSVVRTFVNGARRDGYSSHRLFRSLYDDNLAYLCGGWGFVFGSGMTSTRISNNYANTNINGGYFCGNRDDIGASGSSVYCAFVANACDNGTNAYTFSGCRGFTLIGNGSESIDSHSIVLSNSNVAINGHFSDRTGEEDIVVQGDGSKVTISRVDSERSPNPNSHRFLNVTGSNHEIILSSISTDKYELYNPSNSTSSVSVVDRRTKNTTVGISGVSDTTISELSFPGFQSGTYGGEITILAVTSATFNPSSGQNSCTYKLLVCKGAQGADLVQIAKVGMASTDPTPDTAISPSLIFSMSGDNLVARHGNPLLTENTNYSFSLTCDGDIRVKR